MVFVFDSFSPHCWKNSVAVSRYFCTTLFNFFRLRPDFQTAQSSANSDSLTPLLEAGMSLTRSKNEVDLLHFLAGSHLFHRTIAVDWVGSSVACWVGSSVACGGLGG